MIRRPPISTLFPYPPLSRPPGPELTGAPFPPRPRGLRGQASGVREELGDGRARRSASHWARVQVLAQRVGEVQVALVAQRSEEHTSELQSQSNLVCRLLLEK